MNDRKRTWIVIATLNLCFAAGLERLSQADPYGVTSDNTQMNKGDQNAAQPTADQAKNNLTDRQIMQQIRQSVIADKSLSMYAHNVKIIAQDGQVILKGPVKNADEKAAIAQKAIDVVGAEHVTNNITIKGS